jgi:hypothetical protein
MSFMSRFQRKPSASSQPEPAVLSQPSLTPTESQVQRIEAERPAQAQVESFDHLLEEPKPTAKRGRKASASLTSVAKESDSRATKTHSASVDPEAETQEPAAAKTAMDELFEESPEKPTKTTVRSLSTSVLKILARKELTMEQKTTQIRALVSLHAEHQPETMTLTEFIDYFRSQALKTKSVQARCRTLDEALEVLHSTSLPSQADKWMQLYLKSAIDHVEALKELCITRHSSRMAQRKCSEGENVIKIMHLETQRASHEQGIRKTLQAQQKKHSLVPHDIGAPVFTTWSEAKALLGSSQPPKWIEVLAKVQPYKLGVKQREPVKRARPDESE